MKANPVDHEFLALIDRHQNIIHRACALYADDLEDRKDLLQEILFQAWRAYPSFKRQASFSTWMYRVALNTAITSFRKTKRKPEHLPINETDAQAPSLIEESDRHEQSNMLYAAIGKLNAVDKALVMLYLDELSGKEIAEVLGLSEGNIRVRINRIKLKLQELITRAQ